MESDKTKKLEARKQGTIKLRTEKLERKKRREVYVKMAKIALQYKWSYIASFIIGIALIVADLFFVQNNRILFDNASNITSVLAFQIIGVFVAVIAVQYILNFINGWLRSFINESIVYEMRRQVLDKIQHLPIRYFDDVHSSKIMSIYYDQLEATKNFIVFDLQNLIKLPITFILTGSYLFTVHPILGVVAFISSALQLLSNLTFKSKINEAIEKQRKVTEDVFFTMGEAMNGIREVKINQIEPLINDRMYDCQKRGVKHNLMYVKYSMLREMIKELPMKIGYIFGISAGIYLMINGDVTAGGLVAFITLLGKMAEPFNGLVGIYKNFQETMTKARGLFEVMDYQTEEQKKGLVLNTDIDMIRFDDVNFKYNDENGDILKNVTFNIKGGSTIAMVGPSGSGKSTIIKLLYRFYEPNSGFVSIDHKSINDYSIESLRGKMSIVSQDVFIFDGTIYDNITLGRKEYTADDVNNALIYSQSLEFVSKLPEGLMTQVGERGVKLSQGQKQRLSIARAIIKKSSILILDEPTSALDVETEESFQISLNLWAKDCTKIIIAHRLTTIRDADYIIFIDDGIVIEQGDPKELINRNGRFKDFWDKQFVFKD